MTFNYDSCGIFLLFRLWKKSRFSGSFVPSIIGNNEDISLIDNAHRSRGNPISETPTLDRPDPPTLRKSARETRKPKRHEEYIGFINHDKSPKEAENIGYMVISEPRTLKEALNSKHAAEWRKSIEVEYKALIDNGTWDLVPLIII